MQKIICLIMVLVLQSCLSVSSYLPDGFDKPNGIGKELQQETLLNSTITSQLTGLAKSSYCDAVTILYKDKIIYSYGETKLPLNCASVRKSIYSVLFGIAEQKGIINLDATLASMGIDDAKQPLTATEKTATIRMLLQARSGIYLPALGESQSNRDLKPKRGQYLPNTFFYYNNWDFNILPIILERKTNKKIGQIIDEWLSIPLGMTHFKPSDVTYQYDDYTEYPQTRVYMTAEDLARIGALYVANGTWNGVQLINSSWIEQSTTAVSKKETETGFDKWADLWDGYAYMWWTDRQEQSFWAAGTGGQFMIVDRPKNLVVVIRKNTGLSLASSAVYNMTEREVTKTNADLIYKLVKSQF